MRTMTMLLVLVGALAGCSSPTAPSPDLRGGVLATFDVSGERFKAFVTNSTTVEALFALQRGESDASIPNGKIRRGAGVGDHNAPFGWHLDAEDVEMAAATIELCDGRPSFVQAHIGEYVDVIGRYCPWGARLVALQDFR
jgi:hypothetical protein